MPLSISSQTVHVWLAELSDFKSDMKALLAFLSPDEVMRAERFHFQLHQERFIISRGLLRRTLSLYTDIPPQEILFSYGLHGKPYLENNPNELQFNVSHSEGLAIFAITAQQEIGVDIQKIEPHFREDVARRFFSPDEYRELMTLTGETRIKGFYERWCRKEAMIKTLGQGVFMSLSEQYCVENIEVPDGYQGAIATVRPIENIIYKRMEPSSG